MSSKIIPLLGLMPWVEMMSVTTQISCSTHDTHQIPLLYITLVDLHPLTVIYPFCDSVTYKTRSESLSPKCHKRGKNYISFRAHTMGGNDVSNCTDSIQYT